MSTFLTQAQEAYQSSLAASCQASKAVTNAREMVAKVRAASEAAQVASINATESLKLKVSQVLTDSRIRMLDAMAEVTTLTAIKTKDILSQAKSALELAEKNAAATKRHTRSTLINRNVAQMAGLDFATTETTYLTKASRAANEAIASARDAEIALHKVMMWEKRVLELMDAINSTVVSQQEAVQKASQTSYAQVQTPSSDLESVQKISSDVQMNNAVITANVEATKKVEGNIAKVGLSAKESAWTAIQATSNAQIALQNAEAAKSIMHIMQKAKTSLLNMNLEKASVVAKAATKVATEARDLAIIATDVAKAIEKNVPKKSTDPIQAIEKSVPKESTDPVHQDMTTPVLIGGFAAIVAIIALGGGAYYMATRKKRKPQLIR